MEYPLEEVRSALARAAAVLLALASQGCALGPDFRAPAPPSTTRYTADPQPSTTVASPGHSGGAQRFLPGRDIPGDWWALFQSPDLDLLVRRALDHSPTIDEARATLRSAQAAYAAGRGALLVPELDGGLAGTRESVPGAVYGLPGFPTSTFTLYAATLNITYNLDLFGASRRQLEALRAQSTHQRWELEAARLSLAGNVVTAAIEIASTRAQIAATADIIASERRQLAVLERQLAAGGVARGDVLAQSAQVAQTEAQLPPLEKRLAQAQHRLAVLVGETPDTVLLPDLDLAQLTLPGELPVSVPAQLVRQRPDVQAAQALLHQASAQVGVATANLLPQLSLTGLLGSETVTAGDVLGPGSRAWNAGAALTQPLFHGGELAARRRGALADLDAAAARYRQTVLSALAEVADSLRAIEADARLLAAQTEAESAASRSLAIARKAYQVGGVSYVALLIAERQYSEAREGRIQAAATRYSDSAALYQALGGGWWNRRG